MIHNGKTQHEQTDVDGNSVVTTLPRQFVYALFLLTFYPIASAS